MACLLIGEKVAGPTCSLDDAGRVVALVMESEPGFLSLGRRRIDSL